MSKRMVSRKPWSNGALSVRVRHVGYKWGTLYKNSDGTYMFFSLTGRKYPVLSLEEIIEWDWSSGA